MPHPWLHIPASDYENHMQEVGQLQALNALTKHYLEKYQPESFALPGCATGNGLEHVKALTKKVYAIDINPGYLERLMQRFGPFIPGLETCCADLLTDELPFRNVNLALAALLFEYADPAKALPNLVKTLDKQGILVIVLQQSRGSSFVSPSKFPSLTILADSAREIDPESLISLARKNGMELLQQEFLEVSVSKRFVVLEFRRILE